MHRVNVSIQPVMCSFDCIFYDPATSQSVGRTRRFHDAERVMEMLIRAGVPGEKRQQVRVAMEENRPATGPLELTDGQIAKLRKS